MLKRSDNGVTMPPIPTVWLRHRFRAIWRWNEEASENSVKRKWSARYDCGPLKDHIEDGPSDFPKDVWDCYKDVRGKIGRQ